MMAAAARSPIPETTQNVERQPKAWPSAVPAGTPRILASVSPANSIAMARARWLNGTRLAATIEPIPKKAPWPKAVTTRATIRKV
jgi:hypothetical protein